jgi:hypothetical protein
MSKDSVLWENPHLIVFVPDSSVDQELARAFLTKTAPKIVEEERVVSQAEVGSFSPQQTFICVWRDITRGVNEYTRDEANRLVEVRRPHAELMAELRVGAPVDCSKFWKKASGMRAGAMDTNAVIDAVNATCSPYRLYWKDPGSPLPRILGMML